MAHHIAEVRDQLVEEGWDPADAEAEAHRRFGDLQRYGPIMRRAERRMIVRERMLHFWDVIIEGGVQFARSARLSPAFTAGIVITLGLGIGANATMYGVVDRLLLRPPEHIDNPREVRRIFVERQNPFSGAMIASATLAYPDYTDLAAHEGLIGVAAYTPESEATVGSGPEASRASVALASAELFPLLGVEPAVGRFFTSEESRAGAPLTVVVSHEYWRRALASRSDIIGSDLEVSGRLHTIVGVAAPGFTGAELAPVDLWLPLEATHVADRGAGSCLDRRGCWWMRAVTRLSSGVPDEVAEAEGTRLHLNGRREDIDAGYYSDRARVVLASVIAAEGPNPSAEASVTAWLVGVSLIVLLIACANVTNLLLARGTQRRHQVAVRVALGIPRGRLVGQVMVESALLALTSGVAALALARWGGGFVRSVLLPGVYFPESAINARVVGVTLAVSLIAGLIAGVGPALQTAQPSLTPALVGTRRESRGGRSRLRTALTVSQAAMSVILLVGAGLFVRSLAELRSLDIGLDTDRLMMAQMEFRSGDLTDEERTRIYLAAAARTERLSTVESAAVVAIPFQWTMVTGLAVPGLDSLPVLPGGGPYYFPVTPGYLETVGVRVLRGRSLAATDSETSTPVAVVSETMARTLWPESDALGKCILIRSDPDDCTTVVGVAEDAAVESYESEPFMAYYLPLEQYTDPPRALFVRARGDVETAAASVATVLRSFSTDVRYADVRTLQEILDPQARSWTLGATMFSVFGLLALLLAGVGLYAVLAFDVARRTRELSIRSALGATRGSLLGAVLRDGGLLAVGGVVLGLTVALVVAPFLSTLLFQVSPRDPMVLLAVATVLVAVSFFASLVPGLRATSVEPATALRSE